MTGLGLVKIRRTLSLLIAAAGASAALFALAVWASPAAGQTGPPSPPDPPAAPVSPDLDPARCSDGSYGFDAAAYPGLASDCRVLTAMRNQWLADPANAGLPAGHALRTWGTGFTWNGVLMGLTDDGPRVTTLDLSWLDIGGSIPAEIAELTALTELFLNHNRLTGPIPPELGTLTGLYQMHLNSNFLSGPLPPELGSLVNMERMAFFDNQLTGSIPAEFGRLVKLTYLDFDRNRLSGPIPPQLGSLVDLEMLWMRGNMFTGRVPAELGALSRLERLYLSGNRLSGRLPPELDALAPANGGSLRILDLCRSGVTGSAPPALAEIWRGFYSEPFCDDDRSPHRTEIAYLASWAVEGCDVLEGFCPERPVDRAQAAAFLAEGVRRLQGAPAGRGAVLADVPAGAWYEAAARWAVSAGVMAAPDGRFDPGGAVTRADLARMLVAAFPHLSETGMDAAGGVFTDMAGRPDDAVRAAESLYAAGVTGGCSVDPARFCPDRPVSRGVLAALLVRTLNLAGA